MYTSVSSESLERLNDQRREDAPDDADAEVLAEDERDLERDALDGLLGAQARDHAVERDAQALADDRPGRRLALVAVGRDEVLRAAGRSVSRGAGESTARE